MLILFSFSSYLHCEWATADKLARGDKRIHMKIKRYKAKQQNSMAFFSEVCPIFLKSEVNKWVKPLCSFDFFYFKGFTSKHCSFSNKHLYCLFQQLDEEPFNPDYVEVDRVLDMSTGVDQNSGEVGHETE